MSNPASRAPARIRTRIRRWGLAAALASAPVLLAPAAVTAGPAHRATVVDPRPAWVGTAADRGAVSPSTTVNARVYLAGRDPKGLTAFATAVSDPHSPTFGHFLTPAQFVARFGPSTAQTDAVRSWLTGSGLTVTGGNQHYLAVRGTAGAVRDAFGVSLHTFATRGQRHRAPAGPVTVPETVAAAVLGVTGLDDTPSLARAQDALPPSPPPVIRAEPCSTSFGQNPATGVPPAYGHANAWTDCGLTPQQLRKAYGLDGTDLTGRGATVAVVDAYTAPDFAADVTTYTHNHGTADFRPGQYTEYPPPGGYRVPANCGSWAIEQAIDVEAAHNIAPDANVAYVPAASCATEDLVDAVGRAVDNHLADAVSGSWTAYNDGSLSPALRAAGDKIFQQAAAEGIGLYFSSGDCGTEDPASPCGQGDNSNGLQTSWPAENPWVTGVGGTSLATDPTGKEMFQTSWGTEKSTLNADKTGWTPAPGGGFPAAFTGGSGGGTSPNYEQPAYQARVVPKNLATTLVTGKHVATPMRVVPDVSADADNNTGMLAGLTYTYPDGVKRYHETRWGGTSLSSPLFMGLQAVAQQVRGGPIGFANPQLYNNYGTWAFEDITDSPLGAGKMIGVVRNDYTRSSDPTSPVLTSLQTFGQDPRLPATAGYDAATGVGAPSTSYVYSYNREHPGPPH